MPNVTLDDEEGARCAGDTQPGDKRAPTGTMSMLVKPGRAATVGRCPRDAAGQAVWARCNEERVDREPGFKERAREVDELVGNAAGVLNAFEQPYRFHAEPCGTSRMPGSGCRGVLQGGVLLKGCPRQRTQSLSSTGNDKAETRVFNVSSQELPIKDSLLFGMRDHDAHGYTCNQEGRGNITQEFVNSREALLCRGRSNLVSRIQCWIWAFLFLWNAHMLHAQGKKKNMNIVLSALHWLMFAYGKTNSSLFVVILCSLQCTPLEVFVIVA